MPHENDEITKAVRTLRLMMERYEEDLPRRAEDVADLFGDTTRARIAALRLAIDALEAKAKV